jgi:hypothetical protein
MNLVIRDVFPTAKQEEMCSVIRSPWSGSSKHTVFEESQHQTKRLSCRHRQEGGRPLVGSLKGSSEFLCLLSLSLSPSPSLLSFSLSLSLSLSLCSTTV